MAALIPVTQPANVEATYEDMFKEITRKLYGEETGNGLHTLGTPVAHIATTGPTAPEGERSFTTLMSDRSLTTTIEYEQNPNVETSTATNFKTEDHLTTAFGLAALMQNGFPTTGTILNTHVIGKQNSNVTTASTTIASNTINVVANTAALNAVVTTVDNNDQQRWTAATTAGDIITWPANGGTVGGKMTSFNGAQKAIKTIKNRNNAAEQHTETATVYHTPNNTSTVVIQTTSTVNNQTPNSRKSKVSQNNQTQAQQANSNQVQLQKRYSCTHCPYSTDRRDLYTRHENIHKEEKPFQCYACLKQFNRADHVKKHFLRMHRELTYDINKTRRTIVTEQKPVIFTQRNNNPTQTQVQPQQQQQQQITNNFITTQQRPGTIQEATSLSIAQTIESVATAQITQTVTQLKQEKTSGDDKSPVKIKREKRFSCCYCPWTGADKWGLKRHLNTHTKPFICMLCDYKAARSERLATHVLKVHNKKACNKCSFLAENQEEYQAHMNEVHPHDQRPSRNTNSSSNTSNVLRTIGNTLVTTNNQVNNFQNPTTSFGTIQTTSTGVAIYTTNDLTGNANNTNGIQEIIVNPSSMVGWRLSATGSLIPPTHLTGTETTTGILTTNNSNQKRGAERLFQYLEADGSDPEDYTRQLKMEAISRNTASVAQDFHNAGGVVNARKYIINKRNNYEAMMKFIQSDDFAKSLKSTSQMLTNNNNRNSNNVLNSLDVLAIGKDKQAMSLSSYDDENDENQTIQHIESPPAYKKSIFEVNSRKSNNPSKGHRLNYLSQQDKENSNSIFTSMEYENNSASAQFQNYVKGIINKYYAEIPLRCTESNMKPAINCRIKLEPGCEELVNNNDKKLSPTKQPQRLIPQMKSKKIDAISNRLSSQLKQEPYDFSEQSSHNTEENERSEILPIPITKTNTTSIHSITERLSNRISEDPYDYESVNNNYKETTHSKMDDETRNYVEYLSNKKDITITFANGNPAIFNFNSPPSSPAPSCSPISTPNDKRKRKQLQPKKITRPDIMTMLRDKYLKRLVDPRLSCTKCTAASGGHNMILFPYHTAGSLALHRHWRHRSNSQKCKICNKVFLRDYSFKIHMILEHNVREWYWQPRTRITNRGQM